MISYQIVGMSIVQSQWDSYTWVEYSDDNKTWTIADTLHVVATSENSKVGTLTGHKYYRFRGQVKGDNNNYARSISVGVAFIGNFA